MNKQPRTYYRVIMPQGFEDINYLETVEQAKQAITNLFSPLRMLGEYDDFWREIRETCRIVKVTEIVEPVENHQMTLSEEQECSDEPSLDQLIEIRGYM